MVRSSKYKDLPSCEIRRFELGLMDIAVFAKRHAQVKKDTYAIYGNFVRHTGTRETYLKLLFITFQI